MKKLWILLVCLLFLPGILGDVTFYGATTLYLKDGDIEVSFVSTGVTMDYCEYDTSNNYILLENINLTCTTNDTVHIQVSELNSNGASGISIGDTVLKFNSTVFGKYETEDDTEDVVSANGDTGEITNIANMYDENWNTYGYLLVTVVDVPKEESVNIYEYYNNIPSNCTHFNYSAKIRFDCLDESTSNISGFVYNYVNNTWDEKFNYSFVGLPFSGNVIENYAPTITINDTTDYISSNQIRTKLFMDVYGGSAAFGGGIRADYYESKITYYTPHNTSTTFNFTGNITGISRSYDYYVDSVLTTDNIAENSFNFTTSETDKTEHEIRFASFYPDPPYDGSSSYTNNILNFSWTPGNYSDREIVVRKSGSYPSSPTDGTEVYNYTDDFYNTSSITSGYYTVWSYNSSYSVFSLTGLDIPWGVINITVYNESNFAEQITPFGILISDSSGSTTYQNVSCTATTHNIDLINDIPYGTNTIFVINATDYKDSTYYKDLVVNTFYNFTFYLAPIETSVDPGSGDPGGSGENYSTTQYYIVQIIDEIGNPVPDAKVIIRRYNNNTETWVDVEGLLTDGYGQAGVWLVPDVLYKVNITASGYDDSLGNNWMPVYIEFDVDRYKTFQLEYADPSYDNDTSFNDVISYTVYYDLNNNILYANYTDSLSQTISSTLTIYESNRTTGNLSVFIMSETRTDDSSWSVSLTNCSINCTYYGVLVVNHTTFGVFSLTVIDDHVIVPDGLPSRPGVTSGSWVNSLFIANYGTSPLSMGWTNFIMFVIMIGLLFRFGQRNAGLGLLLCGSMFIFINGVIGFGNWQSYSIPISFIIFGVLVQWQNHRKEDYE